MSLLASRSDQFESRTESLRYVLVADTDVERGDACLEAIKPFGLGVLIAREAEEAVRIVRRFGPPTLLIVDLALPKPDGFAVIDAVQRPPRASTPVIAWAPSREVREFAAHRLAGLNVRVLDGAAAPLVLRGAIERALQANGTIEPGESTADPSPEDLNEAMTALSEQAMRLTHVSGAAVYLKVPHDPQLHATITWKYDEPAADTLDFLPHVAAHIMRTGNPLIVADASVHAVDRPPLPRLGAVRGFAAVPVTGTDGIVIGAVCVFDLKPMVMTAGDVEKLKAIGRGHSTGPSAAADAASPVERPAASRSAQPPPPANIEPIVNRKLVDWPATLMDRRHGLHAIAREWALANRHEHAFSIVLFRVDRLTADGRPTNVLDEEGLAKLASTLTRVMRASDAAIRWSGVELLLLLPALGQREAHRVAERIRATMQAAAGFGLAVCGAVVELSRDDTPQSLMTRAYQKVQAAREHGHNRVA